MKIMKQFEALKTYYIHEFSAINDWFGNRGIIIQKSDVKEWCYDGDYLHIAPSESTTQELFELEKDCDVLTFAFDSSCVEVYDELPYERSPFGRKIEQKNKD